MEKSINFKDFDCVLSKEEMKKFFGGSDKSECYYNCLGKAVDLETLEIFWDLCAKDCGIQ